MFPVRIVAKEVLALPVYPELGLEQRRYVVGFVERFARVYETTKQAWINYWTPWILSKNLEFPV